MKLHTPQQREAGKRWYCGAFAFSVITGCDFIQTRERINEVRGVKQTQGITGLHEDTLTKALDNAGYNAKLKYSSAGYDSAGLTMKSPTLNRWLKELDKADESIYLIVVTGHFVVTKGRQQLIDNHTKHPVSAFSAPWQRKLVKKVYKIL